MLLDQQLVSGLVNKVELKYQVSGLINKAMTMESNSQQEEEVLCYDEESHQNSQERQLEERNHVFSVLIFSQRAVQVMDNKALKI